jgi:short-subunit dehydrogenase
MTQTVAITGASAGMGRAAARMFAARRAKVGLIARGEEGLRGAAEDATTARAPTTGRTANSTVPPIHDVREE